MSFGAHEEKVMGLFNRKVYNVPRNQRRYVWNKDNWQELFDDVMAVVKGTIPSHFIGSIVLAPAMLRLYSSNVVGIKRLCERLFSAILR